MIARLRRLVALRASDSLAQRVIDGLHIEGPFLNAEPGFRGAHPLDALCNADADLAERLLDAAGGLARIFTLAPERDPGGRVVRRLAARGVMVSAGHTNATLDELKAAIDAGLGMFTHLGNGCPALLPRHDNIIQRALSLRRDLWLCFIADGVHIPFPALRNYLDLAVPTGKCIVTTDAMAAAGLGPGKYRLGRWEVVVGSDLAARSPDGSHLVGSASSMRQAAANLAQLGFSRETIESLTCCAPQRAFASNGR
jgi:N-acetylglucosamine-6-phosphate deacetylase